MKITLQNLLIGIALIPWLSFATRPVSFAQETRIVSPRGLDVQEGNVRGTVPPDPLRGQAIYPASDFAALPATHRLLTGIAFRPDATNNAVSMSTKSFVLTLSTTGMSDLDPRLDDNVGPDATIVANRPLSWSSDLPPGAGPKPFEYRIDFDAPFLYSPDMGNLLVDFTISGFSRFETFVDSERLVGAGRISQYGEPNAEFALAGDPVLSVLEFVFVPEPATGTLMIIGIVIGARIRRLRIESRRRL